MDVASEKSPLSDIYFSRFLSKSYLKNLTISKEAYNCRNVNATANSWSDILRLILIQFQVQKCGVAFHGDKIIIVKQNKLLSTKTVTNVRYFGSENSLATFIFTLSVTLRYEHQIKISFVRLKSSGDNFLKLNS